MGDVPPQPVLEDEDDPQNAADSDAVLETWKPSASSIENCSLTKFLIFLSEKYAVNLPAADYDALHTWSVQNNLQFWKAFLEFSQTIVTGLSQSSTSLVVFEKPEKETAKPALVDGKWFPSLRINIAENLLRHHVTSPNKPALVFRTESAQNDISYGVKMTYADLYEQVTALASGMRRLGVRKGDAVAGILPNDPNAVVIMLATQALGAMWSCCSPDFGVDAILNRFEQVNPTVLFASPSYVYKGKVHSAAGNWSRILSCLPNLRLFFTLPGCQSVYGDEQLENEYGNHRGMSQMTFKSLMAEGAAALRLSRTFTFEQVSFSDPAFVLFSSGTTGKPKCIVHGAGIILNHLKEHQLHMDVSEWSKVFFYTTTGWMMHNWLVSTLYQGATTILYDGAAIPPDCPSRLLRIAQEESITHFGASALYFQALEDNGIIGNTVVSGYLPPGTEPLSELRTVMATGSPSATNNFVFVKKTMGTNIQYVSLSGGTDIVGCFALGCPWKPVRPPRLQCLGLGMDVAVLDDEGNSVQNESGELVCRNVVPCMPLYFLNDEGCRRYKSSYFEKYGSNVWHHGDFAELTEDGALIITGRSDCTLNPGGVRIGTSDVYELLDGRPEVEDAIVVGQRMNGDERVLLFLVLKGAVVMTQALRTDIRSDIRKRLSPRHVPAQIIQVPEIPYTFSGKKMETAVRDVVNGKRVSTDAMRNPSSISHIATIIATFGREP